MRKPMIFRIFWTVITLAVILPFFTVSTGHAAPETVLISYQGLITNSEGKPLEEGEYKIYFSLYRDNAGSELVWANTGQAVKIMNGQLNCMIGVTNELPAIVFDKSYPLWLSVRINDDKPLQPMTKLVMSPYAVRSIYSDTAQFAHRGGSGGISTVNAGLGLTGGGSNNSITLSIAEDGVDSSMMAIDAIGTEQIQDDGITEADIANQAVTSAHIMNSTIMSHDIRSGEVRQGNLATNAVNSDKIYDGSILDADIAANAAIDPAKIAGTAAVTTQKNTFTAIQRFAYNTAMGDVVDPGTHKLYVESPLQGPNGSTVYVENTGAAGIGMVVVASSTDNTVLLSQEGSGNVLRCDSWTGGWHPVFTVKNDGGIKVQHDGTGYAADIYGNVAIRETTGTLVMELGKGLDYAEGFDVNDDNDEVSPGAVLVIDESNPGELKLSDEAYDSKVAGIVAGANDLGSGVRLGAGQFDHDVALAGRVYCNVDAKYGEIKAGDLLTTSPTPGYAMVVKERQKAHGSILGKAMESMAEGESGQILVLVTLQ